MLTSPPNGKLPNKVKILFLSSYAHLVLQRSKTRVSGGAELQLALLSRELVTRSHAGRPIEVVVAGGDTGQPDGAIYDGVRVRNAGKFHTGQPLEMLGAIPRVAEILRQERPDWVMVLGWTAWLFLLCGLKPWFGGRLGFICGLDTEVNGEFRRANPLRGALFEFALRRCDVRYAMTEHQRQLFHAAGMSCGFYRNLILPRSGDPPPEKPIDLLWVSRCQPIKRPLLFLDLVEALPTARCRMVCPPEDAALFAQVRARAAQLPNLELSERVPYDEIQAVYDSAKVFVNTSEWEGWPNSFIQAGLGQTALLSLDVNPDDLFAKFQPGHYAAGNWPDFLQAAQSLLDNEARWRQAGRNAERFVRELHDNARETDAFLAGLPPLA